MGFPAEAIPDVLSGIAAAGWAVNERGEPEYRDRKTGAVFYDIAPESWMRDQAGLGGRWHYLTRQGSGAVGGGGASGADQSLSGKNPWMKNQWNETDQALAYRADPVRAAAMAKNLLAGVRPCFPPFRADGDGRRGWR
jgi:hypothetical protein